MKVVEGELKMLGAYTVDSAGRIYSYSNIEIGDQLLRNIKAYAPLTGFLQRGLNMEGKTKLFLTGKGIIAVELPDGKRYYTEHSFFRGLLVVICGILLTPVFGIGLIMLWNGVNILREWKASVEAYAPNAIAVN